MPELEPEGNRLKKNLASTHPPSPAARKVDDGTEKGPKLQTILLPPNLPIDFPAHTACTSVAAVAKSVLNLAHEPQVLEQGLVHLDEVLRRPEPLHKPMEEPGGSVLLHELVGNLPDRQYAIEPSMNCKASTNALTWLQPNILEFKGPPLC